MKLPRKKSSLVFSLWFFLQIVAYFTGYYQHREVWQCEFRVYEQTLETLRGTGADDPKEVLRIDPDAKTAYLKSRYQTCRIDERGYINSRWGRYPMEKYGYHLFKYPLVVLLLGFIVLLFEKVVLNRPSL